MPAGLVLQFLGLPQLYLDNKPIATDRRKAIALLAYLAVNDIGSAPQRYSRESLSALLWPDYDQAKAFSNLRRTIWEVHQAIGESWLIAERESVHLNPEVEIDLDIAHFRALISESHKQPDLSLRIPLLVDAVTLYRNHFLTGFSLKDAYPFNEWAYAESEELRHQLVDILTTLSEDYCGLGQADKAIPYGRRLVSLEPLNESAHRRLMEVYLQAGQHSAALKQYQTCEQILRKELNLDPQPETRALYKKIRKGEIKPTQVEKQIEPIKPKHNLPLQISTFIGREKEQDEIIKLLERNRLVTIAGVGGIGKTRLSLQVGQRLLSYYPEGVWFISFDSLSDPALVPQTVATVFDIREGSNLPVIEILINVLREKTTLLILDNCEHLLEGCAQLITVLLTNCPSLKILATSRETLNIAGESIYSMPALSLPEQDNHSLEALAEYEAVKLLTERATLALSSFALTKETAQTVVDICRRVDGIPLAIELAAARVNILQVEEILKQLEDSFSLLSSDHRIASQRHQTLRASMDWSWRLLNDDEQIFLQQLSDFSGGWTLESAESVCDGNVLGLTSALVKKSLIAVKQETGRETRYRFHEMVRQYAREKLIESGEEETISTQHLNYFLKLSEQAEIALRGAEQVKWFSRIFDERDNIRAALVWADKTDNVETGLYISGRLDRFWDSFDMREGSSWLGEFLGKSESKAFPRARARALCTQGWLLEWLQRSAEARSAAQECLDLYQAFGDKEGEVEALLLLGFISEAPKSVELNLQALTLAQLIGDTWRQAKALAFLGWTDSRDFKRSVGYWEKAISLFRKVSDLRFLAGLLGTLGYFLALNGDIELAQEYLDESTLWLQQLDPKNFVLHKNKGGYIQIALMRGDYEQARALLQTMQNLSQENGDRMTYLWTRVRLGYLDLHDGKISEARHAFSENAQSFQENENTIGVVFTLEGMASLYVTVGKPERAARLIGLADATREKIGDTRPLLEQADLDKIIAACLTKMGEVAFSDAYDEGQAMTLDEAVAYALSEN
jgi:predicted ATPase/DNA-binding SARP family transcriptional activator